MWVAADESTLFVLSMLRILARPLCPLSMENGRHASSTMSRLHFKTKLSKSCPSSPPLTTNDNPSRLWGAAADSRARRCWNAYGDDKLPG